MKQISPEFLVAQFTHIADPALEGLERRSCVAAVRIVQQCLEPFGLRVRPHTVKFIVEMPGRELTYVSGLTAEEEQDGKARAASWMEFTQEDSWKGHLIALVEDRILVDPTFDEAFLAFVDAGRLASYQRHGSLVMPLGKAVEENFELEMLGTTNEGETLKVRYMSKPDERYLTAPAWELDHIQPLIDAISFRMRQALS